MAQGSRASGRVPGSQQRAELSTLHTSPTVTAGVTAPLPPVLCAEPHALDTMAIPHQGPACFCDLTSCRHLKELWAPRVQSFFFPHCSELPIYFQHILDNGSVRTHGPLMCIGPLCLQARGSDFPVWPSSFRWGLLVWLISDFIKIAIDKETDFKFIPMKS